MNAARQALHADNARAYREKLRAKVRELRAAVVAMILDKRARMKALREAAREARRAYKLEAKARRASLFEKLAEEVKAHKAQARAEYAAQRERASRFSVSQVERAREALAAERKYQREIRRIESWNTRQKKEIHRTTKAERRTESDDEVRGNIPPELRALFDKVRRSIKAGAHHSRTEAFLKYAEEHETEVLEALGDTTDDAIADLERQAKKHARGVRKTKYTRAELAAVPF